MFPHETFMLKIKKTLPLLYHTTNKEKYRLVSLFLGLCSVLFHTLPFLPYNLQFISTSLPYFILFFSVLFHTLPYPNLPYPLYCILSSLTLASYSLLYTIILQSTKPHSNMSLLPSFSSYFQFQESLTTHFDNLKMGNIQVCAVYLLSFLLTDIQTCDTVHETVADGLSLLAVLLHYALIISVT